MKTDKLQSWILHQNYKTWGLKNLVVQVKHLDLGNYALSPDKCPIYWMSDILYKAWTKE